MAAAARSAGAGRERGALFPSALILSACPLPAARRTELNTTSPEHSNIPRARHSLSRAPSLEIQLCPRFRALPPRAAPALTPSADADGLTAPVRTDAVARYGTGWGPGRARAGWPVRTTLAVRVLHIHV